MLLAELRNRPSLVLSEDTDKRFKLYTSNKKEVEELQELLALELDHCDERFNKYDFLFMTDIQVNMVGHLSEVKPNNVSDLIRKKKDHIFKPVEYGDKEEICHEYICYQEHRLSKGNNNVIKHEEKLSSFVCACELLQTKYFIVLKETKVSTLPEGKVVIFGVTRNSEDNNRFEDMWKGDNESWK